MFDYFHTTVKERHNEMEMAEEKERKTKNLKKNFKLVMVALFVLAIQKVVEFIAALFHRPEPCVETLVKYNCTKISSQP